MAGEEAKLVKVDFEPVSEGRLFDDPASRVATGRLVLRTYNRKKREWSSAPISEPLHSRLELERALESLERDLREAKDLGRRFLSR